MCKPTSDTFVIPITPDPRWAKEFWHSLVPLKEQIIDHPIFVKAAEGRLSISTIKRALIGFYPLVEAFPKFMALNLAKTDRTIPGHVISRQWLIHNIAVEASHADWWCNWAVGLGCSKSSLDAASQNGDYATLNSYLWRVNTKCSLVEGIAATNLAIEWPTGEWAKRLSKHANSVISGGTANRKQTLRWLRAHAAYDDLHPYEAMELIKQLACDPITRKRALIAARHSMEYYLKALNACLTNDS